MKKLLTISIAAYNIEHYLNKALESCIIPKYMQFLDVIIIDDGSNDNTAKIAEEFVHKYPDTFRLFRKENGGYGSTINKSIKEADGKYFKLLDGDDFFSKDGLEQLIQALLDCDSDLILNPYYKVYDHDPENFQLSTNEWRKYSNSTQHISSITDIFQIGIWETTVRTSILYSSSYQLPEHMLYTDQLFIMKLLPYINTIHFADFAVYCYRIGRNEQSVSALSLMKNYRDTISVFYESVYLFKQYNGSSDNTKQLLCAKSANCFYVAVNALLLFNPSHKYKNEILELKKYCIKNSPEVYNTAIKISKTIKILHYSGYSFYRLLSKSKRASI